MKMNSATNCHITVLNHDWINIMVVTIITIIIVDMTTSVNKLPCVVLDDSKRLLVAARFKASHIFLSR